MPLEIRELIIKAVVSDPSEEQNSGGGSDSAIAQEDIIRQCVEQVMAILKEKQER